MPALRNSLSVWRLSCWSVPLTHPDTIDCTPRAASYGVVCSVTTVWSIPDRFRGELLTMGCYTNPASFTFTFRYNRSSCANFTAGLQRGWLPSNIIIIVFILQMWPNNFLYFVFSNIISLICLRCSCHWSCLSCTLLDNGHLCLL